MSTKQFNIKGRLLNTQKEALSNLRIEVWDKDLIVDDFLAETRSDSEGRFQISFSSERFKELFFDNKPDVYFKVFDGKKLVYDTLHTILFDLDHDQDILDIIIDMQQTNVEPNDPPIPSDSSRSIQFSGFVKHTNGNVLAKITLVLSELQLRKKNKLTSTHSNESGRYQLSATSSMENGTYLLEVLDDAGKVLASEKIFKPMQNIQIDFTITDSRFKNSSDFKRKEPVLKQYRDQLNAAEQKTPLSIADVLQVSSETNLKPRETFHWMRANELETETKLPAELFYGLFGQNLPTDLGSLSALNGTELKVAILKAAENSLISDELAAKADVMIEDWNGYIVDKALAHVPQKMDASLSQIIGLSIKDLNTQKKLVTAYLTHEGELSAFWEQVKDITKDENSAAQLQTHLKLGALTANQPEILQALTSQFAQSENIFHELAGWNQTNWEDFVNELATKNNKSVVPTFIEGINEADRVSIYAKQIKNTMEVAYPTHSFFGKLEHQGEQQSAFKSSSDLVLFFKNNPSFDFETSPSSSLLDQDAVFSFDGIREKEIVVSELQSIQRLVSYTKNFELINVLKTADLDAAYKIVSMPQNQFMSTYSMHFESVEKSVHLYKQAEKNYMQSALVWAKAHPNLSIQTTTTPNPISDPTLRTMFGTLDACECEHCSSVFSPAAYYTDILNFLYTRTPDVYTELIRRRPDLIHLELSCQNTNTPLPYVDLVNELLEKFILTHRNPPLVFPSSYQTGLTAKELSANPEHLNYQAYDQLKTAVYPRLLPFNLPIEETRIYLKHLGVQKHQLMTTFFAGTKEQAFDDFNIAMERLNFNTQEAQILSGETLGDGTANSGLWNFYGFDRATGYKALADPADSSKQITAGNWDVALTGRVDVFIQQTDLSYKELLSLLLCHSINPITSIDADGNEIRAISITSIDGDNASCELDNLRLQGMTMAHLQKIHRFIRLWKNRSWNLFDLDVSVLAFQLDFGNNIPQNKQKLTQIAQVGFLSKQLKLPIEQMLVFWSPISTLTSIDYFKDSYPKINSAYEKLFKNKAVINPLDAAFANPGALSGQLDNHLATILAAIQISSDEYSCFKTLLPNNDLNLSNLSLLHRNALLAKKMKLSAKDFISLRKLIGAGINIFANPVATYQFLLKAETVKTSGFSINQLNYILHHDYLEEYGVAPDDLEISSFLSQLRASLRAIESSSIEEQQNTVVQKFSEKLKLTVPATGLLLKNYVKGLTDPTKAVVEDFLSSNFSSFDFLRRYPNQDPTQKEYEPIFVRSTPVVDITLCAVPNLFNDYMKLEKIASLITKLKLSDSELTLILEHSATIGCTNLITLPITGIASDFNLFETLINLVKARDMLPIGSPEFSVFVSHAITSPSKTAWMNALITRTNWDRTSVEALIGTDLVLNNAGILKANFPASFVNGTLILQLKACLKAQQKIGLTSTLIGQTCQADLNQSVSESIKNAAKSKYDEAQWLKIAKPLRDELREKQRQALVAYVVCHSNFKPAQNQFERWKNTDELYEYLLIDVEMKPINMTSRLKQAICSVQLFIDRVLMNLEHPNSNPLVSPLKLNGDQVEEWNEWRKIYRVWEANRKIFLYPENWIEPELRDDKSPFFKDLETLLKQNELTEENVEDAFHAYLNKLDEVARLEVVGMFHQLEKDLPDEADIDILHVFARTSTNPHKYYHRTLEQNEWTAWKKMEIDLDGNHIVPAIMNRKLCVFSLFFTQETKEVENLNPNSSSIVGPDRWWKIQVAWSEYRKNKWTAKKLSKSYVTSKKVKLKSSLEAYKKGLSLRHWIDDEHVEFAEEPFDGKLHLYLDTPDACYIGDTGESGSTFVFDNANSDPKIIEDYAFASFITPDSTIVNEQRIESEFEGNNLVINKAGERRLPNGMMVGEIKSLHVLNDSSQGNYQLVIPTNEEDPYGKHFFFQDKINTFYVRHTHVEKPAFNLPNYGFGNWKNDLDKGWKELYPVELVDDPLGPIVNPSDLYTDPTPELFDQYLGIDAFFSDPKKMNKSLEQLKRSMDRKSQNGLLLEEGNTETAVFAMTAESNLAKVGKKAKKRSTTKKAGNTHPKKQGGIQLFDVGEILVEKFVPEDSFTFSTHYHAHVKTFIQELYKHGIKGLLKRTIQTQTDTMNFNGSYDPTELVSTPYPTNQVDFSYGSAYSQYNWELFFHVPMLIASRLKDDQQFEKARNWFHYIFNPTNSEGGDKERFWQFKPFYDLAGAPIETLDELLHNEAELSEQIEKWMLDPFKPHVIARIRISAYMKNIVMKYLDNLIAWADNLFRRDTIEAINQATNLYVQVSKILGERPQDIPPRAAHDEASFNDIKDDLDLFSNALVQIETMISPSASSNTSSGSANALGEMFFFSVPRNEFILKYWETVADRLFKIRNSMNIEGVVRTLPLFEPPIDPAMLVRAAAAGMDLNSILNDMNSSTPNYRFTFMLQKANEFTNEVKSLGSVLLQVLEKRDSEAMSLLRSTHEQKMLEAVLSIKEKQLDDAKEQLESIKKSKENTELKYKYYNSRQLLNNFEKQQLDSIQIGMIFSVIQGEISTIGGTLAAIPNLKAGAPTSMGVTWGGDNLGALMSAISTYMGIYAALNNAQGSMADIMGRHTRRMDDWKFQATTSAKELEQIEKQLISGEIKIAIAEKDMSNQELQIENSKELDEFMRAKFTNEQLYEWMIGQISTVYFQSYQLAFDLAKKAETCYKAELGTEDNASFIQFGYWDSLKKGLLSAEKLQYDLRRMESAYYDKNKRELELTKHVSLLMLDPQKVIDLRSSGTCTFVIPESIFDLDYPGHFFRRIKSVSMSIPCIAGPYTTINASLHLLSHTTRKNKLGETYECADYAADSSRFNHVVGGNKPIATSSGQNDSGLFELNFRDERYLPFEYCGAFGEWKLDLIEDKELRMFDYETISDVIFTIRYTAQEDQGPFKTLVSNYLKTVITDTIAPTNSSSGLELKRMFNLKHEFSTEWHQFLHPAILNSDQTFLLNLKSNHFPFLTKERTIVVTKIDLLVKSKVDGNYNFQITAKNKSNTVINTGEIESFEHPVLSDLETQTLDSATTGFNVENLDVFSQIAIKLKHTDALNYHSISSSPEEIVDFSIIVYYKLEALVEPE